MEFLESDSVFQKSTTWPDTPADENPPPTYSCSLKKDEKPKSYFLKFSDLRSISSFITSNLLNYRHWVNNIIYPKEKLLKLILVEKIERRKAYFNQQRCQFTKV